MLADPDARIVASQADATVVVYDARRTERSELAQTIRVLGASQTDVVGTVATRSRQRANVYSSTPPLVAS